MRVYAKASQQAARDSLDMQRAANGEVNAQGVGGFIQQLVNFLGSCLRLGDDVRG